MAGSNARCREEVVRTIVSLLVTEKPAYNIPIPKLESLYRSSECERIPYRVLGYPSVVEFLRTIPQIQIVTRDGTNLINFLGSEKTRDLSELVARQRTSQKSQRSRSTCRGRGPRGIPQGYFPRSQSAFPPRTSDTFSRLCTETLEILERSQGGLSRTNLMYKVREKKLGYFDMQNLNDILLHLGGKVVVSDQMVFAAARARHNEISWEGDRREPPRPQNPVVVRNFQVEEEDDYFGDFEEHQAPAKDEKPLAITSGPQGEDPAKEDPMPGVNDPRTQAEVEMIINERMRFRLEKLIQNRPEGIWCAELAKIYHEVYNLTLEWQQLGFNSLSDLVLHLPDIFYCVQPSPTGDFRVFDAKNKDKGTVMPVKMTLSAIHQIYPDPEDDVRAVPAGLSPETINRLIPEDVVRLGETIGQVLIDCFNQEDKGYEEVVVCDAFTPSFFWIHLRRKILKLDTMMERLQEYYEQKGSTYNVPLIVLEKGLNVVCKFYGKWHRGIVKTVEPDAESTTTVLFYDYGTLHKYPATAMHFLHRKFSNLPAQAIPCGLYNIKPPEDYGALKNPDGKVRWSIETSRRFVQRVHDRPLVAICGKKFPENNSMLLSLTDTSSDEDVNIGEWLVNDGLAVHGSMVRIRPKNFPYKHSLTCKPTERYEKPCKAIKKLFPNVKPPPPVDVSKLSNNKKRVSKVESLRAKLLEKASAKRGVKCPTCGQPILKLPDVKVEKVPDVAHMNGVIPPVNGVSMPPMNGVMSPVDELFEKIPHLNPTAMKMIGHWVETGYMPRLGVPSAQESTPEWEERGLAPDEVLAEAHRPAEQVETPPEVEEKVLTPEEIPPEPHRPAGEAEAPLEVERTPLHLAPPATTDDDALSEFDTVLKPQRQILQSGVIDWETFRLIEKNPKPKPVEKGELLKSIPKPKRKIVETRELFDDASVGGDAPAEELGEIKHEMIIPIIKQALRNNKKELKYSRVVISRDILGERAGSNGPVESSGGPGDDEKVKGVEGGVDEGRVINGEAGGSGEVREEGKEEFSELFEGIPKINSSSLQKEDESRPEILSPPSGLVESSDVKATVDGELPEEDMRINEKGEEKEEEAKEIKFSPSLEAIPQINSSTPQNEDNSTPRALIEEVLSPKQESNDTSQDNRDEDNSPPVEETPKNRRVLIEELSSSEDSDGVEMVSVYAELLKKSPRFLKQILHRNSPEESSELDSDDESSEMSNDEESINKSIEEIETIGRDEVPEIVETTEKSNNEIIPTESIENSLISTLKSKYNSYNNENSNENLGEGNSSLELINNEKNLLTNHVPLDNSQIPVFDAADFNSDDEEFDVYFASENKIYGVIPQIGRFREIMMNGDDEEDVINEDSSKMIIPNSSNEIRTDDGDVEEVYRSPEDTDDSIGLKIDPNDLNQYTEDYDWERTEEAPERPQAAPGNEGNNPIIQNLVVKGVIASTRLAERGAQLMGAIDSLISLNFKEVDVSMVDVQSLLSLKKTILEDWEEFCPEKPKRSWKFLFGQKSQNASEDGTVTVNGVDQSFSSTRDVACGPLGSEEGLGGLQESLRTSQDSSEACRTVEGQGDQGTLEPLEENDVEDLGSFHSGSSIRILDECDESMYSAFDLPDTNPFKNDLMSATTCPFPENNEQKAPPPIPPRTKRHSSISNLSRIGDDTLPEVNNNVTQCLNTSDIEAWRNGNYLSAQQNGNCSSPGDQQPSEGSRRLSAPPGFRPIVPPRTLRRDINRNLTEGSELNSSNSILAVSSDTQGSRSVKRPDCLQVDLSRCSVSIFFMDGAGWITIDQFRQALTNFTDSLPIRKILVERQDETCFRVIRREENPRMFEIIRRKGRGGEQHSETEMNAFYLVPVNIVLCKMLRAFGLVSQEDLKRYTANYGVTDHPVLQELSLIFGACKEVVRCMNR